MIHNKKRLARLLLYICLFFCFSLTVVSIDIDARVEDALASDGYAHVIILVREELSDETKALVAEDSFIHGAETQALQKILRDKKKTIRMQQSNVLSRLNVGDAEMIQHGIDTQELKREGVDFVLEKRYNYVNGLSGIVTKEGYKKLLAHPDVIGVYTNENLGIFLADAVPFVTGDFATNLSFNGSAIDGNGIGICVIDTGVDADHDGISRSIVEEYCYCSSDGGCCPNGKTEDSSAEDDNGHGTAVIGTIVSQDSVERGIAVGADIIAIKAFNSDGSATTSDVFSGITKCLEKAEKHNIKVFSFSFGGSSYSTACDTDPLAAVVNDLQDLGFFVAAASGNNGESYKLTTPACGSKVTSVGAVYDTSSSNADTVASFSNANNLLDVLAPGVDICTTAISGSGSASCNSNSDAEVEGSSKYKQYSGTSFSAPLVAGAAALVAQYKVIEENIVIDPTDIHAALTTYGKTVLDSRNGLTFPRLDIQSTLQGIDDTAPVLAFVDPTPADNTKVKATNVTINVSVADSVNKIVLCTYATNGTNTTMEIIGEGREVSCSIVREVSISETFVVYAMDNNGNVGVTEERGFIAGNSAPTVSDVLITPETAYYDSDLNCTYTYTDNDNDPENGTEISWYQNNNSVIHVTNSSIVNSSYIARGDLWSCTVTPSDGQETGNTVQSNSIEIENYLPVLVITGNNTVYATEDVVLDAAVSDGDNDNVTVSLNDTRFTQTNNTFTMNTSLNSSAFFSVVFSATDGFDTVTTSIDVTILPATDTDGDDIPDFTDNDDDGDGITDESDNVFGSANDISTNINNMNVEINGSSDLNRTMHGALAVAFTADGNTLVSFVHDFDTAELELYGVSIMSEEKENGNIVVTNVSADNKTVSIDDSNTSSTAVCVQDVAQASLETMTYSCNGTDEYLVDCDGSDVDGYTCTDIGDVLVISGLQHSAVQERCIDTDSDGYGDGCSLGDDCADDNAAVHPDAPEIADNGIDDDCRSGDAHVEAEVEEEVAATSTATGSAGGGAGGTVERTSDEEASSSEETTETQQLSEDTEERQDTEHTEEIITTTAVTSEDDREGDSLTGAAVAFDGSRTIPSWLMIVFAVLAGVALLSAGAYVVVRRQRDTDKGFTLKDSLLDFYNGIKDLFRKY